MKKILLCFLSLIIVVSGLSGCSNGEPKDKIKLNLYFSSTSGDTLEKETTYIDASHRKSVTALAKEVMALLFKGPSTAGLKAVIPEGTFLRGVSASKEAGTINIDLSKEYYKNIPKDAPKSEELLARYSIVYTLCQFDEIKKVKIYVDGKSMMASSGNDQQLAAFGAESIMINSPSSTETQTEKFVTLYFTDKTGINLYAETRKATMTDNSLAKTVVGELIRGPVFDKYTRTFSESTQLISIDEKEGVCFVNFSSGFLSGISDDTSAVRTAVYSVVNSLTRIPEFSKVQILIDGKKPESDAHQLFSIPLERDESMIVRVK